MNFEEISRDKRSENLTGADLANLITQSALESIIKEQKKIRQENFMAGLAQLKGSIQENDLRAYEKLRKKWAKE